MKIAVVGAGNAGCFTALWFAWFGRKEKVEVESIGVAFCQKLLGAETNWKQTSYNSNMRGNYAGIGYTYMSNVATLGVGSTDIFISQQPYACLLYTSPSPRDRQKSRMPSSA